MPKFHFIVRYEGEVNADNKADAEAFAYEVLQDNIGAMTIHIPTMAMCENCGEEFMGEEVPVCTTCGTKAR